MSQALLYPLRFEPIYQYRLWGGRRLAHLLTAPLTGEGPIGEAWVLSDRAGHQSRIANGSLTGQDDKDASLFPIAIPNPSGHPELAILHRPLFPGTRPGETACKSVSRAVDLDRESIWISYCPMPVNGDCTSRLGKFTLHHRLATPVSKWERLKIGGGTPPVLTRHGWLVVYHGVSEMEQASKDTHPLRYSAGVMVLSKEHQQIIRYRSAEPVLTPSLPQERDGTVANVVFPTGIDRRDDLGRPDRFDRYYGMADNRIGVSRLDLPEFLPPGGVADAPEARV